MTVSIDNTSNIKLTFNDNTTATVIQSNRFDWVVVENQTRYTNDMILHLLQNWYERQSNYLRRHTGGYNG